MIWTWECKFHPLCAPWRTALKPRMVCGFCSGWLFQEDFVSPTPRCPLAGSNPACLHVEHRAYRKRRRLPPVHCLRLPRNISSTTLEGQQLLTSHLGWLKIQGFTIIEKNTKGGYRPYFHTTFWQEEGEGLQATVAYSPVREIFHLIIEVQENVLSLGTVSLGLHIEFRGGRGSKNLLGLILD